MTCRLVLAFVMLLTSAACVAAPERAQDGNSSLQLMASDGDWADDSFTGHAFVCVRLKTDSDVLEDCFGFFREPRVLRSSAGLA